MLLTNPHMVVPGNRSIISPGNFTTSPRSPLDMRFLSPGSSKRYDDGVVGLGIVAALEQSKKQEILLKQNPVYYLNRSNPVHCARRNQFIDLSEEYTCVTTRDGVTRVYYNDDDKFEFRYNNKPDVLRDSQEVSAKKRDSLEFLSLCCLCEKTLQGKDIYMYKGDRGFCSKECRSVRIMEDNNLDGQHKSTSVEVLSSHRCTGGQVSPTGIFVI